jgi:hypothetical protein
VNEFLQSVSNPAVYAAGDVATMIGLTKINQNRMAKETGIQSSLSEDDIKGYLKQVIQEVQKQKTYPTND